MGNVSSKAEEGAPVFLRDQTKFSVSSVVVTNSRNRVILNIAPNTFPAAKYIGRRDLGDDSALDFVQDPEASIQPSFLLKLSNDEELNFNFTFVIRQQPGEIPLETSIAGLTFIFASSTKEIDNLRTREFQADPNLHKNPNVHLVGDYATHGNPTIQFGFSWKWKPPKPVEDKGGGWRTCCSFVEYNQRSHRLDTLASFTFWVHNSQRFLGSPTASPRLDVGIPPRLRLPSTQSIESRVSDSDNADAVSNPQLSPTLEGVPEYGLGLVPSIPGSSTAASSKVDVNFVARPGEDVTMVEDGPLFRATLKDLESKTGSIRSRWKRVLRAAEAAQDAQAMSNSAMAALMASLKDVSSSSAVQPAIEHYFDKIAKEILAFERSNTTNIGKMIIDPISRLYNVDIKQAEGKKKDFDDESRDFYQYLNRYLGQRSDSLKEKKRAETDSKYQNKRRNFELKRFDYSSFVQDLHGGRKDQEILSQLTRYAEAQAHGYLTTAKKIELMIPQLDALTSEVKEADKEFQMARTEREEKRRALEKSNKPYNDPAHAPVLAVQPSTPGSAKPGAETDGTPRATAALPTFRITSGSGATMQMRSGANSVIPPPSGAETLGTSPKDKFKGIRDLQERDHGISGDLDAGQQRKEGLLWALSRPGNHVDPKGLNKQSWHKFWIVLDQGKLTEYQNWKNQLELHMGPIDLRVASVREARNAERRFCLELITPQFTRVYQATSEDDMRSWINNINNALQSAVEGKNVPERISTDSLPGSTRKDIASVLTGKSSSVSSHHKKPITSTLPSRHATVGERPAPKPPVDTEAGQKLLKQIRDADAGNQYCADCGGTDKVDWVSINLGIVICIECSGIHRSLGTHISKVRSIMLDPTSFTPDVVEILLTMGNRVSNMVWEARLQRSGKPTFQATREQRLRFITAKYADRAYVNPIDAAHSHFATADETLLANIKKNDIQNVMYALALRANPNVHDKTRGTHSVFLALAATDPAPPSGTSTPTGLGTPDHRRSPSGASYTGPANSKDGGAPCPPPTRKPFAVAELLLLNNADLPALPAPIPLSTSARAYLDQKAEQRSGRKIMPAAAITQDGAKLDGTSDGRSEGVRTQPGVAVGGSANASSGAGPAASGPGAFSANGVGGGAVREREQIHKLQKRSSAGGRLVKSMYGPPAA